MLVCIHSSNLDDTLKISRNKLNMLNVPMIIHKTNIDNFQDIFIYRVFPSVYLEGCCCLFPVWNQVSTVATPVTITSGGQIRTDSKDYLRVLNKNPRNLT